MMISGFVGSYIDPPGMEVLRNYKYTGGGSTPIDNLLNPFWEWAVNRLPLWISPNILTLMGFWCTFVCMGLTCLFMPTLTEPAPWYIYLANFLLLFSYQTLDAIDGKQARRTKTSSPLGQLLDHGCDSFSTVFAVFTILGTVRMGHCCVAFLLLAILQMQMFTYSWWELHFGVYRCHTGVTGVTEGQLIMMGLNLTTLAFGPDIFLVSFGSAIPQFIGDWVPSKFFNMSIQHLVAIPFYMILIGMLIADIVNGCRKAKAKVMAISQLSGCLTHVLMQFALYESKMIEIHPVLCYWTIVFYSSIIALRLNMSSTCRMHFSPIQYPVLPFWVVSICAYVFSGPRENSWLGTFLPSIIDPNDQELYQQYVAYSLLFVFLFGAVYLYDIVLSTISSICAHLKISCFTVSCNQNKLNNSSVKCDKTHFKSC